MTDDINKNSQSDEQRQFLSFSVMNDEYAVDIMSVLEIKGWTAVTRLPNSPEFVRGVMNLRGTIIPIFDVRARFCGKLTEATEAHVVIILNVDRRSIGILVDSVSDILTISPSEIKPTPELEDDTDASFIEGLISVDGKMIVILDVVPLFDTEKLKDTEETTNSKTTN